MEEEEIFALMSAAELRGKYPNPGDRYVAICKMEKYLYQKLPCVKYAPHRVSGGYVSLNRVVSDYNIRHYKIEVMSYLSIDEDIFNVVFPCFEKYYPYLRNRYYDDNYIPDWTTKDIIEEIKNTKHMIASRSQSEEVREYLKKAYISSEEANNKEYMNSIFGMMDFLCSWLEMNIDAGGDYMINITEP